MNNIRRLSSQIKYFNKQLASAPPESQQRATLLANRCTTVRTPHLVVDVVVIVPVAAVAVVVVAAAAVVVAVVDDVVAVANGVVAVGEHGDELFARKEEAISSELRSGCV